MTTVTSEEQEQLTYPYGSASSDEIILAGLLNALHHNSGVPQDRIRAEVKNGRAVLSGVVDQECQRDLAGRTAEEAPGVVAVTNHITLAS